MGRGEEEGWEGKEGKREKAGEKRSRRRRGEEVGERKRGIVLSREEALLD